MADTIEVLKAAREKAETEAKIIWEGEPPKDQDLIEVLVRKDMRSDGIDMNKPPNLVFCTVWLEDNFEGEHVIVWGKNDDPDFHAKFYPRDNSEVSA